MKLTTTLQFPLYNIFDSRLEKSADGSSRFESGRVLRPSLPSLYARRGTCYELRTTSYVLRTTGYALKATRYDLRTYIYMCYRYKPNLIFYKIGIITE